MGSACKSGYYYTYASSNGISQIVRTRACHSTSSGEKRHHTPSLEPLKFSFEVSEHWTTTRHLSPFSKQLYSCFCFFFSPLSPLVSSLFFHRIDLACSWSITTWYMSVTCNLMPWTFKYCWGKGSQSQTTKEISACPQRQRSRHIALCMPFRPTKPMSLSFNKEILSMSLLFIKVSVFCFFLSKNDFPCHLLSESASFFSFGLSPSFLFHP